MTQYVKKRGVLTVLSALCLFLVAADTGTRGPDREVKRYYNRQLQQLKADLEAFEAGAPLLSEQAIRQMFRDCRTKYKSVEFLVEYYYPTAAGKINGAPLPEAEPSEPNEPEH